VQAGNVYIKGLDEEMLSQLLDGKFKKLDKNFRYYVRLSPRKTRTEADEKEYQTAEEIHFREGVGFVTPDKKVRLRIFD
jgi:hypothetical protein